MPAGKADIQASIKGQLKSGILREPKVRYAAAAAACCPCPCAQAGGKALFVPRNKSGPYHRPTTTPLRETASTPHDRPAGGPSVTWAS
jgi:hypothetical protein